MMKAKPMGTLWMTPAVWLSRLSRTARRARKALPEGHLVARTNKSTLLDDAVWGFEGTAAGRPVGEPGRRQRLARTHDPSRERRHLFGVGEGPAEAVAEAKQERARWGRGAWSCKDGLHEPAKRTKICTKPVRLAFGEPSANLRQES